MTDLVMLQREQAVCSSRDVAVNFRKKHKHVMDTIRNLMAENSAVKSMFRRSKYVSERGREEGHYLNNRDGFTLLVMGFTGKEALEWKLKYISAFNGMEKFITEKHSAQWKETRSIGKAQRLALTDVIKRLSEYATEQGCQHATMLYSNYSKLAKKTVGIDDRELATAKELMRLAMVEDIICQVVTLGIAMELHYKEIYQQCKERLAMFGKIALMG